MEYKVGEFLENQKIIILDSEGNKLIDTIDGRHRCDFVRYEGEESGIHRALWIPENTSKMYNVKLVNSIWIGSGDYEVRNTLAEFFGSSDREPECSYCGKRDGDLIAWKHDGYGKATNWHHKACHKTAQKRYEKLAEMARRPKYQFSEALDATLRGDFD